MKTIFLEMERLRNPFSGLGQFCWHLGKEFSQMPPDSDFDFTFYLPENQQINFANKVNYQSVSKWHKVFPLRGKYDIWHCLHQDSKYLPNRKDTKLILTIHDLNFLERDDYSNLRKQLQIQALQKKIDRSSAITYISEFTKKTVQQNLTIPPNVVEKVIYNGNNISSELLENNHKTFQPSRQEFKSEKLKYIFSIGIIQAKKNFHVLLPILQKYQDLSWFIAGDTS